MNWLYDKNGKARMLLKDDVLISSDGKNLAWVIGGKVYSLQGKHKGWHEKGALYDAKNCCLAFEKDATGYIPSRPGIGSTPGVPSTPAKPSRPPIGSTNPRSSFGQWSRNDAVDYLLGRVSDDD